MSETAGSTSVDWRQATFDAEKEVAQLPSWGRNDAFSALPARKQSLSSSVQPLERGRPVPKIKIYTIPEKSFLRLMGRGMWVG